MAQLDLSAVMDAVAANVPEALTKRAYAWPVETVSPPCAVVGYPTSIDFDATFGRGSDKVVMPLWFVVGAVSDKAARDALSAVIAGADAVKDSLDGDLSGTVQTCRVTDCQIDQLLIGAITYLTARFTLEIYT